MADWSVGDWAFVYFSEDGYWYPAEIIEIDGESFLMRYEYDEAEEWVEEDCLDDYSTYVGEEGAECYWDEDEAYFPVSILDTRDEEALVQFEDEQQAWVDLTYLRFEE